ncbi:Androgen-induced protein [Toxocara canis]|uniref:Androgen-induced protein n=1 Tax=Toxocara canis TaxID=6265 RepID=A0A0B2UPE1_TOXCA|nr:Androgen-induced protein [Toxocara canis]
MVCYARAALHFSLFVVFVWAVRFDDTFPPERLPVPGYYSSKLVWLTIVDLFLQAAYHAYAFYVSLTFASSDSTSLHRFHFLSAAIVQPVALTVGLLFWSFYSIDPKILIPENMIVAFSANSWANHAQHTLPPVAMLADQLLWMHPRANKKSAFMALLIFAFLYVVDVHVVHAISGYWAYGILAQLPAVLRTIFILACAAVLYLAFLVGDTFNALCHSLFDNKVARD